MVDPYLEPRGGVGGGGGCFACLRGCEMRDPGNEVAVISSFLPKIRGRTAQDTITTTAK